MGDWGRENVGKLAMRKPHLLLPCICNPSGHRETAETYSHVENTCNFTIILELSPPAHFFKKRKEGLVSKRDVLEIDRCFVSGLPRQFFFPLHLPDTYVSKSFLAKHRRDLCRSRFLQHKPLFQKDPNLPSSLGELQSGPLDFDGKGHGGSCRGKD